MATNFEPHEYVNFVQFTKIGTHEYKAIHSILGKEDISVFQTPYFLLDPI